MAGNTNFFGAVARANSHLRYWQYRRTLRNGGPTLPTACAQWVRRFAFEWLGLGRGA